MNNQEKTYTKLKEVQDCLLKIKKMEHLSTDEFNVDLHHELVYTVIDHMTTIIDDVITLCE